MRLLIVNFAMDPLDPVLGFTAEWARSIGRHFDEAHVLTGRTTVPAGDSGVGVSDIGWVPGQTPVNVYRLVRAFNRTVAEFQPSVVFVHMAAAYAAIIGPLCRVRSIPMVLWYEHQAVSWELRVAERSSSAVVSASGSYAGSREPIVVGHGIAISEFGPRPRSSSLPGGNLVASVHAGRADRVKRLERIAGQLSEARRKSRLPYTFTQIGSASERDGDQADYSREWQIGDWVRCEPTVSRQELARRLRSFDFFVHSYGGAIDKAPLEASLAGLPVLSEGKAAYAALGGAGEPPILEEQLDQLRGMSADEVDDFVRRQQASVIQNHSLESTSCRIAQILQDQVDK